MPKPPADPKVKYGANFPSEFTDLDIEFACIQHGGQWQSSFNGEPRTLGLGLFEHYRNAQRLLWPDDDEHKWTELLLGNIVNNDVSVILGASDTGKTFSISKFVLTDWWAFPDKTLWMVSSTERRGAELRNWGAIKQLFNSARARHPSLPGTILESLACITTEAIDDKNKVARLLTKGIIFIPTKVGGKFVSLGAYLGIKGGTKNARLGHFGDECFPSGTLVDTPCGPRAIETIRVGDEVFCAIGNGKVTATMSRLTKQLVRVRTQDGRSFACTPEHRVFTKKGWKKARLLKASDYIIGTDEAMRIVQHGTARKGMPQVLQAMPYEEDRLCGMSRGVRSEFLHKSEILQQTVPSHVASKAAGISQETSDPRTEREDSPSSPFAFPKAPRRISQAGEVHSFLPQVRNGVSSCNKQPHLRTLQNSEKAVRGMRKGVHAASILPVYPTILFNLLWKEVELAYANGSGESIVGNDSRLRMGAQGSEGGSFWTEVLQAGCFDTRDSIGNRSGRPQSHIGKREKKRSEKNSVLGGAWVDSVEVLEFSDSESEKGCVSEDGVRVYNLSVERHPSYSVSGFLVHNCQVMQRSFLDAYSNFFGKQHFKGLLCGNPLDLDDCLCIAAEPVDGWNTWKDNEKTQTWRSKFYDAAVVALDGRDSPNMDLPEGSPTKFKYLIGRKKIKAVERTHGKDSWQYHSQCTGKPRPGAMARRVISRQLCDERHAFDDVIWGTEPTIRIMGCDAAYGGVGGDRCVAGHIEFGKDVDGNLTLACNPPVIVPVAVSKKGLPEEQIANWCKDYAESFNIQPGNFYFDGRGTLAVYLGRIWSPDVNSVEFGGKPTDRPVSMDEFIWDGDTKTRRLKRCDEHYSKFVTELWFSLFYIIAAGQMRRLPMDVAEEGWRREWRKVKGDRIEVETKEDMKLRTGQSPDLFDWLAICGEGARRKGFEIRNTSNTEPQQGEDENWLEDELKRYMKELRKTQLRYA